MQQSVERLLIAPQLAGLLRELSPFVDYGMTASEVQKILTCVETAMEVYRRNEGQLTVPEIRTFSFLRVVYDEISDQAKKLGVSSTP